MKEPETKQPAIGDREVLCIRMTRLIQNKMECLKWNTDWNPGESIELLEYILLLTCCGQMEQIYKRIGMAIISKGYAIFEKDVDPFLTEGVAISKEDLDRVWSLADKSYLEVYWKGFEVHLKVGQRSEQ